ncbi:MAG TPA: zf-HC2 domain-containing protein [Polyangiaceae bacterium]|nr:zf-HC2 domain-containing protein [Polyangiaceae bacterium]
MTHECRGRARALGSFLDGELEASRLVEIDEHLRGCATCREEVQLLRAMRGSIKKVVRAPAPGGLRDRIANAMTAERGRSDWPGDAGSEGDSASGSSSWRTMVPLATAAAIALVWGTATQRGLPSGTPLLQQADLGGDLLEELVAEHSQPLPPEATNAQAVRGLERYVGVPVQPANFERGGARLVGGRIVPLRSQRAAMLQYVIGTGDAARRVSVYVYDAEKLHVGAKNLAPRAVGTAEVRVGREKGYSVAATQRAGVGYLLATDLDPERSAQLAAMVYDDR